MCSGDTTSFQGMDPEGPLPPFVCDDDDLSAAVDAQDFHEQKMAALRAHATQITVLDDDGEPPAYTLSNDLAQPVLDAESFVLLRGPASPGDALFP